MRLPAWPYLLALFILVLVLAITLAFAPMRAPVKQCESLQECIEGANVYGYYEATYSDSYSSPGGTSTTTRTYGVSNDQLVRCINCSVIYSSGYGTTTGECQGGANDCSTIMKQTDILGTVRNMNVSREFRLGTRNCFRGQVAAAETFDAIVCFDEMNRITNYAEQGKRPFYRFNLAGYDEELSFS